jgi:hypothetical protein
MKHQAMMGFKILGAIEIDSAGRFRRPESLRTHRFRCWEDGSRRRRPRAITEGVPRCRLRWGGQCRRRAGGADAGEANHFCHGDRLRVRKGSFSHNFLTLAVKRFEGDGAAVDVARLLFL